MHRSILMLRNVNIDMTVRRWLTISTPRAETTTAVTSATSTSTSASSSSLALATAMPAQRPHTHLDRDVSKCQAEVQSLGWMPLGGQPAGEGAGWCGHLKSQAKQLGAAETFREAMPLQLSKQAGNDSRPRYLVLRATCDTEPGAGLLRIGVKGRTPQLQDGVDAGLPGDDVVGHRDHAGCRPDG